MFTKTYWNNNGEEQAKYNEMVDAGFEFTKASKANIHSYYRYYNDGDMPGWARSQWQMKEWNGKKLNERGLEELERRATEVVLKEYSRYQKACRK